MLCNANYIGICVRYMIDLDVREFCIKKLSIVGYIEVPSFSCLGSQHTSRPTRSDLVLRTSVLRRAKKATWQCMSVRGSSAIALFSSSFDHIAGCAYACRHMILLNASPLPRFQHPGQGQGVCFHCQHVSSFHFQ